MMMRLSPKRAREPFSTRLFRRSIQCGLATAPEPRYGFSFCRGEQQVSFPQTPIFRAVCTFTTSASRPDLPRSSAVLPKWSSVCTTPRNGRQLLSKGVHIFQCDAKRDEKLQNGHVRQRRNTHSECESSMACTNEEYAVLKSKVSFSSCESNGENRNIEEVQSRDGGKLYTRVASSIKFRNCRRFRENPEAAKVRLKLDLCSKEANLQDALVLFDQVKREQRVQFDVYAYNILLYLCSGAASGKLLQDSRRIKKSSKTTTQKDENAGKGLNAHEDSNSSKVWIHFNPEDIELAVTRAADILEDMLQQGVEPNEATYTSIVRLAVAKNDGDLAFETIKLMESSGVPPKLRSYGPLLQLFCACNKADKVYEVDDHMLNLGVQPDESMMDSLLKVSMEAGREDKIYSLLHRLRTSLRELLPTTVQSIEQWFTSDHAALAGKTKWKSPPSKEDLRRAMVASGGGCHGLGWLGTGAWQVKRTSISKTGSCLSCRDMLCVVDLDTKDTEDFANSIAKLACESHKGLSQFPNFQDWLDRQGPFDAIIDGANVGLYNPKLYNGFNVSLLQAVINEASARFCTRKPPLVILHSRHMHDIAKASNNDARLHRRRKDYIPFFTPKGANDDWFWLYAAVKCKCMLLSNDLMRDHIFALLGNNFFPKWKERHQVRFTFTHKSLEIHMPPPYSTIIQESQNGSWHVPQALQTGDDDNEVLREWLCVTRSGAAS